MGGGKREGREGSESLSLPGCAPLEGRDGPTEGASAEAPRGGTGFAIP